MERFRVFQSLLLVLLRRIWGFYYRLFFGHHLSHDKLVFVCTVPRLFRPEGDLHNEWRSCANIVIEI
jgi:hypothetical protein